MAVLVRDANVNDYKALNSLNLNGLGYDYPIELTKQRLNLVLDNQKARIYVAEFDGAVAGYIHAVDYDCIYFDSLKNILAIVVDESYRGNGVGKSLLSAVEKWAKEDGASGVRLVSGENRKNAHKFYKACGYKDRKVQKNLIKLFNE